MHLCHTVFTLYVNLRLFHSLISSYLVVRSALNTLTALLITGYPFIFSNVSASCFAAVKPWTVASSSHEQKLSLLMVNQWASNGQEQHNWTTWQKNILIFLAASLCATLVFACFLTVMQTGGLINSLHLYFSQHQMSSSVFTVGKLLKFLSPYKLLNYWRYWKIEWYHSMNTGYLSDPRKCHQLFVRGLKAKCVIHKMQTTTNVLRLISLGLLGDHLLTVCMWSHLLLWFMAQSH